MDRRRPCLPARADRGFTLIEIVVVLLIVSVLIAMGAAMTRGMVAAQQRQLTTVRIAGIDASLLQFVATQRRLPCPADGTLGPGSPILGTEMPLDGAGNCTQQNGVVPFRALGLVELDALDGWGRRLTYRVDPQLARANAMDMSGCDPAGNPGLTAGVGATPAYSCKPACSVTVTSNCCASNHLDMCTTPLNFVTSDGTAAKAKGLCVQSAAAVPVALMVPSTGSGAAYFLLSAGETGGGAFLPSGVVGSSTTTDGTGEAKNYATLALQPCYTDDALFETGGVSHFDDVTSHPGVIAVALKAGLGPRAHN